MTMIDTHAHLCDEAFDLDLETILEKATKAGVTGIISVGENMRDAEKNLYLTERYDRIFATAGLYPANVDTDEAEKVISLIRRHKDKLVGIGEVGLDYWVAKDEREKEIQREIFLRFVVLSKELNLPLNVHSRSAGKYAISLLLESGVKKVQLHAFDGKASAALPGVEAGYYFSIPPSVVRSRQKQKLVKKLPLSCLLLETDSPVLGPDREERNEPSNLKVVVAAISEIKGIRLEKVIEETYRNTLSLYEALKSPLSRDQ